MPGTGNFFCRHCHTLATNTSTFILRQSSRLWLWHNLVVGRIKMLSRLKMLSYTRKRSKKGTHRHVCVLCVLTFVDDLKVPSWAALRKVKLDSGIPLLLRDSLSVLPASFLPCVPQNPVSPACLLESTWVFCLHYSSNWQA